MKEMNINIEGYNVNGICVGCLNYNRKMFYNRAVKDCFLVLASIDVPDGLTLQVCWECLARMKSALVLRTQLLKAYDRLIAYSRQHRFLDSPFDLSKHAMNRLYVSILAGDSIGASDLKEEDAVEDPEVKEELDEKLELEIDLNETITKQEDLLQNDHVMDDHDIGDHDMSDHKMSDHDDLLVPMNDMNDRVSSDDDIQLSKLKVLKKKEKKSKRGRKKRDRGEDISNEKPTKRTKKRRKLPPDMVEVYKMSEEEMWRVREGDKGCEEFKGMKHTCADCVISFQTGKQREYHMTGKHGQKSDTAMACDVCKGYYLSKESLTAHRNLHLSALRCLKCEFITTMKRIMEIHLCVKHEYGKMHSCSDCRQDFSTKSKLNYHKVQCSLERPQCDCCGKVFANKMTLKHHLKQLSAQTEKTKPKLFIPCKGCDKVFFSRKSYRSHVVIHDGLTYPCPVCGKLFQWKRNLSRHIRNHREREVGAAHQCRECGKSFASRDCYNNHMRLSKRHAPEAGYVHACHYCGKKFATKWCMVDHIDWDHLKLIKYQCSVCFKAFKTAKIMVAHMNNIHEGKNKKEPDGEHLCDVCGRSYKTVKRLKGHVWAMHTNRSQAKSFKCSLCPATFTWQTSIYKHVKMMHDNAKRKQPRAPPTKKPEPYPDIELANRMQYFQQNIATNIVQNMVPPPLNIVQNL
ncbi:uncharacterized protein [Epargyreus clarus]|uniref:uncharacterized protein n=1 Tax=Epargyreus clarus TaxID=520877 RepID=UPI003C2F37F8